MSFSQSKAKRKKAKYQNVLMKAIGVTLSDSYTKTLVLCNGGLTNGLTIEDIIETCGENYNVKNVFMIPHHSFSIISFQTINDSVKAYNEMHNKPIWPQIKGPAFFAFISDTSQKIYEHLDFHTKPKGLIIIEDFITEEEETFIISILECTSNTIHFQSKLKHRKVIHYGYEFKYTENNVTLSEPIDEIPKEFEFIWNKLERQPKDLHNFSRLKPDQLTVNYYEPGEGIPSHVDTHSAFEDPIFSLSLLSNIVMEFKKDEEYCHVILPRRSLCIISGESRFGWTHGITPRKSDVIPYKNGGLTLQKRSLRISLTFRKTKQSECTCNFYNLCDTYKKNQSHSNELQKSKITDLVGQKNVATKLEHTYVHEVYEKIASHFSETRHKPWPKVKAFVESFTVGSILVDVGCGNGKYFEVQSKWFEVGCDASNSLMKVCKERGFECFSCNCLNLPLRDNSIDGCFSIAVIHHLSSEERRKKAITEMIRILKPGGRGLIYVWAKDQEHLNKKSNYLLNRRNQTFSEYALLKGVDELCLPVHSNRTNFDHSDLLVPWNLKSVIKEEEIIPEHHKKRYLRFYHVFEDYELKKLLEPLIDIDIKDYYYDQGKNVSTSSKNEGKLITFERIQNKLKSILFEHLKPQIGYSYERVTLGKKLPYIVNNKLVKYKPPMKKSKKGHKVDFFLLSEHC